MFQGQGSQKEGMADQLLEKYEEEFEITSEILGESVKEICLHNDEKLRNTKYTQPILFLINDLMYREYCIYNEEPQYLIGHSLGEYNALCAAKVFSFEEGVKLTKIRGELMASVGEGSMLAIIDLPFEEVEEIIANFNRVYISNINSFAQVVVSGEKDEIRKLQSFLQKNNVKSVVLNVSGAFHSPYMAPVIPTFRETLEVIELSEPAKIVVSNFSALPYTKENIINNLCLHLTNPVRWVESNIYLKQQGVEKMVQIGQGHTLNAFARNIWKYSNT